MKSVLIALFIGFATTFMLMGCSTLSGLTEDDRAKFAFQYGALKVIDGDADRADRLAALIDKAQVHIEEGAEVSISFLESELKEQIEARDYAPEDKLLFYTAIAEARNRLIDRVGEGALNSDQRLQLLTVLNWMKDAARGTLSP